MPYVSVSEDTWTTIAVTTTDTVFQNRSAKKMFITSESTGGLSVREGFALGPEDSIVYGGGHTVKASIYLGTGLMYYSAIGDI